MKERSGKLNRSMLWCIVSLAWPTMLEQLMQTAVQYVDTAMVGSLGTAATAAVGSTVTVNWLINSVVSAVAIGFLAYIARTLGAKDTESAKRAAAQAVSVAMILGTVITVLTLAVSPVLPTILQVDKGIRAMASRYFFILYIPMLPRTLSIILGTVLRASGDTKRPMLIGLLTNLINVVLNFMFIYPTREITLLGKEITVLGLDWGIEGAAAASAVAFLIGGILITVALWKNESVSPKGERWRINFDILKPCFKVALPNVWQRFATCMGYVAFASMINSVGETASAAHTVANTVESLFYIPGYGMQTATATLIGNAYGARDEKGMLSLAKMFIPIEIILMVISGAALFLSAPWLVSLFSSDASVISLGTTVLRMVALSEPFFGFSIIAEGILQGVGRTRAPFLYNVIGMWAVRIVGTFICTQCLGFGLVSAWGCMILHNIVLFLMFLINYIRGYWNPFLQKNLKN